MGFQTIVSYMGIERFSRMFGYYMVGSVVGFGVGGPLGG